jgi:Domain of unknown function (DUF1840)
MLFEFKSRATGTVVMTGDVGKRVLPLMGKSPDPQGIITVDQMPAAIAALEAACKREKELAAEARKKPAGAGTAPGGAAQDDPGKDPDDDPHLIGISQRVFPLIEMLRAAHAANKDITWGV